MKINKNTLVLDYQNNPIPKDKKEGSETTEYLTYLEVIVMALNSSVDLDKLDDSEKIRVYKISINMYSPEEEVELSIDDVAFILKRVRKVYTPLVIGRVEEFFNQSVENKTV